jgi:putative FmdB family regulatory protein
MPTYEYKCACGHKQDAFYKISERPDSVLCHKCGEQAQFIISCPLILCDDAVNVPWIRDFGQSRIEHRKCGKKAIETRGEYKQYLEKHNLVPGDGENLSEV